jgi:hypothetical protein
MPTTLKPIIFGKDKKIDFKKFNVGSLIKAITFDMEEFGEKGVQGLKIADNYKRLISYEEKANRAKDPYLQAGIANGSLWLVVRDKDNDKFEAIDLVVKDYAAIKKKLAASTASVTDIGSGKDKIIKDSVKDTGAKLGVAPSKDPNFGEITGNIVLTAHGRPQTMPSGRVVGVALGKKSPKDIVTLLTGSKDPKKRIGKDFNGQITLCGCFTASGGPEGEKQDDPFAKKVHALLVSGGYTKASVVGYPGATITVDVAGKDSQGTKTKRGDEKVLANQATGADSAKAKKLEKAITAAIKSYNALVDPYNAAQKEKKDALSDLQKAFGDSGMKQPEFLATKEGKKGAVRMKTANDAFKKVEAKFSKAKKALEDAKAVSKKSGFEDTYAKLEGRFGLRQIN